MPDLFDAQMQEQQRQSAPLAERMRPRTLAEFTGQQRVVGPTSLLYKAIKDDELFSLIFWGPPGSGKTTLARIIANESKSVFVPFSAVMSGVGDLKKVIAEAADRLKFHKQRTILFLDEIHRWNKSQQDALLPHVENGTITLIGATTENPSFEVISPLLSRTRVVVFERLSADDISAIIQTALNDAERGLGNRKLGIANEALRFLAKQSNGDARAALSALDIAARNAKPGSKRITLDDVKAALMDPTMLYDKSGEEHYNTVSAFIKSLRGSDADAALYWLARMIEAGENPRFIARRMVILASEDIGNADPHALILAVSAWQAVEFLGMPESQLTLAQAATYLADAPKSNAVYEAIAKARADAKETPDAPVPLHLRNAATGLMRDLGYGKNYAYTHDYEPGDTQAAQEYRPDAVKGNTYYNRSRNRRKPVRT